jgi:VWFA-related protein
MVPRSQIPREILSLRATLLRLTLVFLLGTGVTAAQSNATQEKPFSIKVPVELVVVPVTVEDGDGRLISGLVKDDFELFEDGVNQKITYFSSDPVPLSVAILFDKSMDRATQQTLRETLLSLVESFSSFDEMALFQFEQTAEKVQEFTSDKEEVLKAFQKVSLSGASPAVAGGPFGGTGGQFSGQTTIGGIPLETAKGKVQPPKTINTHINDAILAATLELRRRDRGRRGVIVMISNGQNAPGNRSSYDSTIEAVLRREITVFAIAQGSALMYRKLNLLSRYANATGGAVYYPVRSSSFSESYQKIAQMARNRYVLGYVPSDPVETVTFRKITVRIKNDSIKFEKVRNRNGYFTVPHSAFKGLTQTEGFP